MQQDPNAAFAFVFYWPVQPHVFRPSFFLIPAASVPELLEKVYFRPAQKGFFFTVRYRSLPSFTRNSFLEELVRGTPALGPYKDTIGRFLPDSFRRNWQASSYLQFARRSKTAPEELKFVSVSNVATDFSEFPRLAPITGLS